MAPWQVVLCILFVTVAVPVAAFLAAAAWAAGTLHGEWLWVKVMRARGSDNRGRDE